MGRQQLRVAFIAMTVCIFIAGCAGTSNITSKVNRISKLASGTLLGQIPAAIKRAQDAGEKSAGDQLANLSITLPLRNQGDLNKTLAGIANPANKQSFLTPQQFKDRFGPTQLEADAVSAYLTATGMRNIKVSSTRQSISFSGSVATVEQAFNVKLHQFTMKDASGNVIKDDAGNTKYFYGPTSDPSLSASTGNLPSFIQSINGLDNFTRYQSHLKMMPQATAGYTPEQIRKAYGADKLISKGTDGAGQTIAFLELSDYNSSDIQAFQQKYNLGNGSFQTIQVDGGAQVDAGAIEVELDMETAFGMAPKASQLIYEGPNTGTGINDIYSQIVNDNKAKVVSISWGLCESSVGSAELNALHQIFQQGAAEGISFFAAAGDAGAYDCGDSNPSVDSPADDPLVTGVGGTSLTLNSDGSYGSEKAWSCTTAHCTANQPKGSGGGGGVSQQFPAPTFQSGLNPTDAGTTSQRFVPDVSANADPATGYDIICTVAAAKCTKSGGLEIVGGTSAAAPVWAGAGALINQYLSQQQKPGLGNANETLYAVKKSNGSVYHDVTSGTNLLYKATQGYDLATGWGSPAIDVLASAIASGNYGTTGGTPNPTQPTPTATSGNPTATPGSGGGVPSGNGQELLTNNGFENGSDPWAQVSSGNYQLITNTLPHQGSYSAELCGYANCKDVIGQGFSVPSGAQHVTLSYYWNMASDKGSSSCQDHFIAAIYSVNSDGSLGNVVKTVQNSCNGDANNAFARKTIDITSIAQSQADQTLAIVFEGTTNNDNANLSNVFVDDVSILAA